MAAQMRNFLDQTGGLWATGAFIGNVGSVLSSSATQHSGQESSIVGLRYSAAGQMGIAEITGGSPTGAATNQGGERMASANELELARFQGRHVAEITAKLAQ
jgi:NAD(P)H dehydrogenase (quinone)